MAPRRIPFEERFVKYVQLSGPDECWPWTGARFQDKYGQLLYGVVRIAGKNRGAHVLTYELFNAPVAPGLVVRHICDNYACCNPRHLIIGTQADNVHDRDIRGRSAKGERVASAKLSAVEVIEIRRRASKGATYRGLARQYKVTPRTIRLIARGESWQHLL